MSYSTYKFVVKEPTFTRQSVGIINKAGNAVLPNAANFYSASLDYVSLLILEREEKERREGEYCSSFV